MYSSYAFDKRWGIVGGYIYPMLECALVILFFDEFS